MPPDICASCGLNEKVHVIWFTLLTNVYSFTFLLSFPCIKDPQNWSTDTAYNIFYAKFPSIWFTFVETERDKPQISAHPMPE